MDKPMSDLGFRGMSLAFKFRDLFAPRGKILEEVGIEQGFSVLDYGCGPGSAVTSGGLFRLSGKGKKTYSFISER